MNDLVDAGLARHRQNHDDQSLFSDNDTVSFSEPYTNGQRHFVATYETEPTVGDWVSLRVVECSGDDSYSPGMLIYRPKQQIADAR